MRDRKPPAKDDLGALDVDVAEGADPQRALMQRRLLARKAERAAATETPKIPQGGGAPLGGDTRKTMERDLGGADLSSVRVHTGAPSAQAANQLGARAFTEGQDIHFNAGQFAPGTRDG